MSSAAIVLRLSRPEGGGHCSVVGKSGAAGFKRNDTVGFRNTGRKVIIGNVELNRGDLLSGEDTPILIQVKCGVFTCFAGLYDDWEISFSVSGIVKVIDCIFTVSGKVFGNLHRNGEEHIVGVEQSGTFKRTGGGASCHKVHLSVILISRDGKTNAELLVGIIIISLIESCSVDTEFIEAVKRIVS